MSNTDAYEIAKEGGFINEEKQRKLENFFEESCLDFEPELDLWIDKLQKAFPWFVNRQTDWPCAPRYGEMVDELEGMDRDSWNAVRQDMLTRDETVSQHMVEKAQEHYAIKYNTFMGVRSDYFLKEE